MGRKSVTLAAKDVKRLVEQMDASADHPLIKKMRDQVLYIEERQREWDAAKKEAKEARQMYDDAVDALIVMAKGDQKGLFDEVAGELTAEELKA